MGLHIVSNKFAKPGFIWVVAYNSVDGEWKTIQVPACDIQIYTNAENYIVPCCQQGYCRDKGVIYLDAYYPYMVESNHCKHCAEVLLDYKESDEQMRPIENIIIHHSLSFWGNAEVIRHWHCDPKPIGNGWKNPGYHIVICNLFPAYFNWHNGNGRFKNDGKIERMLPDSKISNGCHGANSRSLNVCLIGNFDILTPTIEQAGGLYHILQSWLDKYSLTKEDIYGHGEMQKKLGGYYVKSCPGKLFDMDFIRGKHG